MEGGGGSVSPTVASSTVVIISGNCRFDDTSQPDWNLLLYQNFDRS